MVRLLRKTAARSSSTKSAVIIAHRSPSPMIEKIRSAIVNQRPAGDRGCTSANPTDVAVITDM